MKYLLLAGFVLLATLFSSCDNDLEIVAPGEEVIVVYSLLNTSDSIQYLKINKGFASQTEAPLQLAQEPDKLFFDSLNIELIDLDRSVSGIIRKQNFAKDPGDFTQAVNYIYTTDLDMTANHRYKLRITNPNTKKVAESELTLLGPPKPNIPNPTNIDIYGIEPGKLFTVNLEADPLAHIYEVRINLIYEEMNSSTGSSTLDTATWIFARGKFNDLGRILIRTEGQEFYDIMAGLIEQKGPEVTRRGKFLQFEYWTADREMSTYLDVYGSSSIGVVQKKTDYTNINGGFGLFAGRNHFLITGTKLDTRIQTQLKTNPVMAPLRFVD